MLDPISSLLAFIDWVIQLYKRQRALLVIGIILIALVMVISIEMHTGT